MAIQTTIARHYAWRNIIFAVVCLVLGLWGVYDYVYAIPAKARHFERGQTCRLVMEALEPGGWSQAAAPAREAVARHLDELLKANMDPQVVASIEADELRTADEETLEARAAEFNRAIESIRENDQENWFMALMLFDQALKAGEPAGPPLTGVHLLAHQVAAQGVEAVANVSQPSTFDRPTQWLFILCLPFVPWALWVFFSTRAKVYRLDDDGTLHMPGRTWPMDQIADIDMSRWMSKSIAQVVHADGQRVTLDDYKHKNLHLIVGAIASRLHPDQWTAEAKVVKKEAGAVAGTSDTAETEQPVVEEEIAGR